MMYVDCFALRTAWLMRRHLIKCLKRYLPKFAAGTGVLEAFGAEFEQTDTKKHRINTLHSNLDGFLHGFRSASIKHLQSYLTWFPWRRLFRTDRNESVIRQVDAQPCPGVTRDWNNIEPPYMEYWGTAA